ncbi:6,7-dimethyl-8-ribityllumazine synthase [Paraburkholderia sp. USG1]|uniref:6,7-dimethyl-8-ribityllumazine synthase n=1 Tax=Paraburkholderia sp. USG1 TaxID=2952268 RepID=UPI002860A74F|nr:6,7-dimethyl-8-ribityllumazine synthase [Paraburkholderia sp. USG1]MDR8394740.1 6,7-dimethyl-8-ribityllumazine synthase [Paraburkholderia sp. USG1]
MTRIAIVYGSYHKKLVDRMVNAARSEAETRSLKIASEIAVPGSMEKPLAVKRLLLNKEIDGVVVLGIIEKGETSHGFVMAQAVINSIIELQVEFMKPVGVGILGPDINPSQLSTRLEPYARAAVVAVNTMLNE